MANTPVNRLTSYFDRKQTLWTHEQMMARLKERCPPIRSEVGESRDEKSVLKWGTPRPFPGGMEVQTDCGSYRCTKHTIDGKTTYELWKANPTPGGSPMVRLNKGLDNFLQAQELAKQDFDNSQGELK